MRLEGKVAIITGGAQGIGAACSMLLAKEGAKVVVSDVADQAGLKLVADIKNSGGDAIYQTADMGSEASILALVEKTVDVFGRIDVCVCAAGIAPHTDFLTLALSEFEKVLSVNLVGPFLIGQAVAKFWVESGIKGSIINITSTSVYQSGPLQASYCSSKAGLGGLTRTMAVALAPHKIRVNAVAPGPTKTELMKQILAENPAVAKPILERTPLGMAEPVEIANAVLFLATDESSFITGETISVDGGRLALNYTVPVDDAKV